MIAGTGQPGSGRAIALGTSRAGREFQIQPQRGIEALDVDAQQPIRRSAKREGGASG